MSMVKNVSIFMEGFSDIVVLSGMLKDEG